MLMKCNGGEEEICRKWKYVSKLQVPHNCTYVQVLGYFPLISERLNPCKSSIK